MYYVAFFIDMKKNMIVPKQWIRDIKLHKEKFYNHSLNSGQVFECFYTNQIEAFDVDGLPRRTFQPNFEARVAKKIDGDGLFRIRLKAYKGK